MASPPPGRGTAFAGQGKAGPVAARRPGAGTLIDVTTSAMPTTAMPAAAMPAAMMPAASPASVIEAAGGVMALLPGPSLPAEPGGFADAARALAAVDGGVGFDQPAGRRRAKIAFEVASLPDLWPGPHGFGNDADLRLAPLGPDSGFAPATGADELFEAAAPANEAANAPGGLDGFEFAGSASAVPEIETWSTLLAGLMLVGLSQRRRPRLRGIAG